MLRLIEKRQTNRGIYDGKKIAENQINGLKEIAKEENVNVHFCENGSDHFTIIKQYIKRGNTIQMNNEKFKDELLSWIRFNKGHVNDTNNGLTYKVMGSPPTPKFMGRAIVKSFLTPEKQNKSDVKKIDSASHFMLLTTKNDSKTEWIHLGRYMQRLLLQLTKMGIANAYLNPPCELSELRSGLQKELPINNELPTILVRLGYAKPAPFSPRKDVEEVISTVKSIV